MDDRKVGVVLGDGQMAAQCARLIAEHGGFELAVIIHHGTESDRSSRIQKISKAHDIPNVAVANVNDVSVLEMLRDIHPDIAFSVNNWDVIRDELLTIPGDGFINFHNGPLPAYRGVNVPSWAIMNRETNHGVTWHRVARKIDAGDVVASAVFELSPQETAATLILRCIKSGIELFPALLDRYVAGDLDARPQEGEGRYFSASDLPPNLGYLDFNWSFEQLSAIVRGLSFRPFDNLFVYPKVRAGRRELLVSRITMQEKRPGLGNWTCGEIRGIDEEGLVVCAGDGLVHVSGLMNNDLEQPAVSEIVKSYGLAVGSTLS